MKLVFLVLGAVWTWCVADALVHPTDVMEPEDWGPEAAVTQPPWHWLNWALLASFLGLGALFEALFPWRDD